MLPINWLIGINNLPFPPPMEGGKDISINWFSLLLQWEKEYLSGHQPTKAIYPVISPIISLDMYPPQESSSNHTA